MDQDLTQEHLTPLDTAGCPGHLQRLAEHPGPGGDLRLSGEHPGGQHSPSLQGMAMGTLSIPSLSLMNTHEQLHIVQLTWGPVNGTDIHTRERNIP